MKKAKNMSPAEIRDELGRVARFLKDVCDAQGHEDNACELCPWRVNCGVEPYAHETDFR